MGAIALGEVAEFSGAVLGDCKHELSAVLGTGKQTIEKPFQAAFRRRLYDKFGDIFVAECPIACPALKKYETKAPRCDFAVVPRGGDALVGIEIKCIEVPSLKYKNPQHYLGQLFYDALKLSGTIPKKKKSKRLFDLLGSDAKVLRFDQAFLVVVAFGGEALAPSHSIDFARQAYNVLFWNWADVLDRYPKRTDLHRGGRKLLELDGAKGPLKAWAYSPAKTPLFSKVKGKGFAYTVAVHELDEALLQPT